MVSWRKHRDNASRGCIKLSSVEDLGIPPRRLCSIQPSADFLPLPTHTYLVLGSSAVWGTHDTAPAHQLHDAKWLKPDTMGEMCYGVHIESQENTSRKKPLLSLLESVD